jgi:hypothetical protein
MPAEYEFLSTEYYVPQPPTEYRSIHLEEGIIPIPVFIPLVDIEYEALKTDIALYGIKKPLVQSTDGTLIDGYTRWSIAIELGIPKKDIPIETVNITTLEDKIEYAKQANRHRLEGGYHIHYIRSSPFVIWKDDVGSYFYSH